MSNYQKLDCWKESMQLVKEVYLLTKFYPKDELFGLTSQTRRAAVSVPSNIAEGLGRQYKKDSLQFLYFKRFSIRIGNTVEHWSNGRNNQVRPNCKYYSIIRKVLKIIEWFNKSL